MEILMRTLYPFQELFIPTTNIYWFFLFSAFGLATLLYIFNLTHEHNHKNLLEYLFPKRIYLHPSFINQCKHYFLTSWYLILILTPGLGLLQKYTIDITYQTLKQITGLSTVFEIKNPQLWHCIALTVFSVLIYDFSFFVAHYMVHKIPFLWEFHKVHHSAEVLTPITTFLAHPVDLLVNQTIIYIISSIASGVWIYIFGNQLQELLILGVNIGFFMFLAIENLQHSHFWIAYPYGISHILSSPVQHQIHHSVDPKHFNKNFGTWLSLWDWICGTLYVPYSYEKLNVGLPDGESKLFNSVTNVFLQPFRAVWQRSRKSSESSQLGGESS